MLGHQWTPWVPTNYSLIFPFQATTLCVKEDDLTKCQGKLLEILKKNSSIIVLAFYYFHMYICCVIGEIRKNGKCKH